MAEPLYTIEKILDKRFSENLGCWIYFVKWENFPDSDNTWEPEENLIPLGKVLENFNKAWESKSKPAAKPQKPAEVPTKKPIVTKVKGLIEQTELPTTKKPLEASFAKSPYLSVDSAKDTNKPPAANPAKSAQSTEKRPPVKKVKKPQPTMDQFGEESVKLITKKNFEKNSAPEVEIDVKNNIFKDCKVVKPKLDMQVPWKVIGTRKRNNVIQYVVVCKGPPICMPVVVTHEELARTFPDLLCDYLFSVIS